MAETSNNLTSALAKVQGSLPTVHKDAKGNFNKYVTLNAIHEVILPLLSTNGLAWITMPTYDENGEPILEYKLMHTSGEKIEGKMRIFIDKQTAQGQGSGITYARRYSICAVIGVTADEDDDGQAATSAGAKPYVKKTPAPPAAPEEPYIDVKRDEPITNAQFLKLQSLIRNKGVSDERQILAIIQRFAQSNYKLDSPKKLTQTQADEIIGTVEMMDGDALKNLVKGSE